jgi:hypothetical protein
VKKMAKELYVICPHCRDKFDLRKEPTYLKMVRKAFFAGQNNKGLGTLLMMFLIMLAIILLMAIRLGMRL